MDDWFLVSMPTCKDFVGKFKCFHSQCSIHSQLTPVCPTVMPVVHIIVVHFSPSSTFAYLQSSFHISVKPSSHYGYVDYADICSQLLTTGIPKFFRFISERWPLISQLVEGDRMTEFDNLYLDMNSILHTCTHSNDSTLTRMTEEQMYASIFNYIDHLFDIIKPKEVFYMAIDGVAPRAKMNQQRARRFRTAIEAEENLKKAIQQGQEIPKDDPFDSNAITPGTEFMAKLTSHLKYFIHKKMTEDSRWSNIKVILSGHEVPGEGEHKIMQFIRTMKSQKDYNPNLRHCIYGLDADLIMLGLVSHDTHFSLLREEVTFGPGSQNKSGDVHDQKFFLLHLSLLREYMALEFQDLEGEMSFEYNFERVLDDFILIMYVIGNDFLPNLPDLHINKGAFPLLIGTFKQSMKHLDGYLNDGGKINFKRLGIWLDYLSEFELENFEKLDVDVDWFNKRLEDISITGEKKRERSGKLLMLKDEKKLVGIIKPWLLETAVRPISELTELANSGSLPTLQLPTEETSAHLEFLKKFALEAGILIIHSKSKDTYEATVDVDGISAYESDEDYNERVTDLKRTLKKYQTANMFATDELMKDAKDLYDSKFVTWKDKYYRDKLKFSIHDDEKMIDFTTHYVEGLQWVLYYYYKGCASWNWYYRYHYAPRISDISRGVNAMLARNQLEVEFDQAKPFKPFEQLMAVLPARSRKLMPDIYRPLMTEDNSPIIDFYPHEVDVDLNGKTASWEAVVLLSFVDEKRLLAALKPVEARLNPEETKRNSYGKDILFISNPQNDSVYPTPLPGFFHDIENDTCFEELFVLPPLDPNFKFELPEGAKTGKDLLAGFPSLYTIPFDSKLALHEVKVFNYPSKSESMILSLKNIWDDMSVNQFSQKFLGKVVYCRWPFLVEGRVTQVWDSEFKYESVKSGSTRKIISSPLSSEELREFHTQGRNISSDLSKLKAIQLGQVAALVHVQPVIGMIRTQKGAYVKAFAEETEVYPIQTIVEDVVNEDERFVVKPPLPLDEEFPAGLPVVFLGAFAYGAPATIAGYTGSDKLNIRVDKIQSTLEPNIGKKRLDIENREIRYLSSYEVAKQLRVNGLFLSKITGSYMLRDKAGRRINVGLDMKFDSRRLKVLGYTRKSGRFWEYSPLAVQLVRDYGNKFKAFFLKLLNLNDRRDMPAVSELCSDAEVKEITSWLKKAKADMIRVTLESDALTRFSVSAIEEYMDNFISKPLPLTNKDIKGVPKEAIINPSMSYHLLRNQRFDLGDRVIYVQDSGKVPKLSKGTTVSITTIGNKTSLGVVFDYPLVSGNNMNGKLKSNRGLIIDSSLVLNISNRQIVYHSKASKGKKPLTEAERANRAKQVEAANAKKREVGQKVEKEQKEKNSKKTNELLSLLKKSENKPPASDGNKDDSEDTSYNSQAIKQIYGHIYSNVMNQGTVPPPGMVLPPVYNGVPPLGIPVVPGVPLPPQFFQQPPPQAVPQNFPQNGGETNGHSGRGGRGRGSSRGLRGGPGRGRGRGRGRSEE